MCFLADLPEARILIAPYVCNEHKTRELYKYHKVSDNSQILVGRWYMKATMNTKHYI